MRLFLRSLLALAVLGTLVAFAHCAAKPSTSAKPVTGWLSWRGPLQTGVSLETGLPDKLTLKPPSLKWTYKLRGAGSPVIGNGKLYALGYEGEGADLQEVLVCLDANTGKRLWEQRFNDFLSDIIYDRYAIGSPAVDAETGNVYAMTSAGVFSCYTADGKLVWRKWMMEDFGRLTFPNGRTGAPFIEDNYVIIRYITSNWGGEGPAADRFYAFDKKTGKLAWSSTPGVQPKDNSFARPFFDWKNGKRLMYTGDGSGHIVAVNARTGEPVWRFPISAGGFNSSVVVHKDKVIGIHNDENVDSTKIGGMVALNVNAPVKPAEPGVAGAPLLDDAARVWRNDLGTVSSSPVLVGDRLYQVSHTGELNCVDMNTGSILWHHKLGPDQLHASPTYGDGKLYIPIQNGQVFVIKPTDQGAQELCKVQLEERCLGAPAIWNGRVYVFSTQKLYCFGNVVRASRPITTLGTVGRASRPTATLFPNVGRDARPTVGATVALQIIPSEVLLHPGEKAIFTIRGIDANGFPTQAFDSKQAKWAKYIPPTARVRAEMDAHFNAQGELVGDKPSAGAWQATIGELKGTIRGRVLAPLPFKEYFEGYNPTETHATEADTKFAYPPLPWIGARFKFEVREVEGTKALTKTLDNTFFQRATVFIGDASMKNYTVEADVRSDGNRRGMSTVGVINQHYMIWLNGNAQELEVNSNHERIKQAVPFKWEPRKWYRLKTRVDLAPDGSGGVRGKAWERGTPEPPSWTIEVKHRNAHKNGSPGLFGFSPQSQFRVYLDNISVTPN